MDYRKAEDIWAMIAETGLTGLRDELVVKAVRYARLRVDWQLVDWNTRNDMDATRTAAHDTFIDSCNILSRNMGNQGEENEWRRLMTNDRKEIGDFACHLHALLGIAAR